MDEDDLRGDRIRELMRTRGHDMSSLARAVGRDRSQVYRWVDGKSMSGDVVGELARELETSRTFLMTGENPEGVDPAVPGLAASVSKLSGVVEAMRDQQVQLLSEISEMRIAAEDQQLPQAPGKHDQEGSG